MLRCHASHPDAFDHTPSPLALPRGTEKKRLNIVLWWEHFVVTWWIQMYCCSVWTIQTLSFLISYTIPKISTTSNFLIPWRILSMAIIVPDRPTPALQWATMGLCSGLTRSLNALTNLKWAHYSQQSQSKHNNPTWRGSEEAPGPRSLAKLWSGSVWWSSLCRLASSGTR